jgi:integrase/recombinase XerD
MTALAPTLQTFLTDYLTRQRKASPHTIAAYRDAIKLLLVFTAKRTGKQPHQLDIADLDAPLIVAFLNHLEHDRHNTVRTRNAGSRRSNPSITTPACATPSTPR